MVGEDGSKKSPTPHTHEFGESSPSHSKHTDERGELYRPVGQMVHEEAPAPLYSPAAQITQAADELEEDVPAGQGVQDAEPSSE